MLVDDHAVVRSGLRLLLDTFAEVECVGTASDGAEAVALAAGVRPDVVLMDLEMPGMDGVEATRRILAGQAGTSVVVLTSFSDRGRILAALDAGAVGYLLKDATPEELERGILAAAAGEAPLDPRAARALLTARRERSETEGLLSAREREVLAMVGQGMANKVIALRLGISEQTVKTHLTSVFRRIGVTDRLQAAMWAQRHGIVDRADLP
jgi:DNA-binding NarL/FixJ family response regulator